MSYLNTRPMLYGMEGGLRNHPHRVQLDYPSNLVKALQAGQIDLGLVPVAALLALDDYSLVSDFCIGTEGEVASVCLFSHVPLAEITSIRLDYQSRTSVLLCKIILRDLYKQEVEYFASQNDADLLSVSGNQAALLIGDRALLARKQFAYVTDLGSAWRQLTQLPFVFAVWVSKLKLDPKFLDDFNRALSKGVKDLDAVIDELSFQEYDLSRYFKQNISYTLDDAKRRGIEEFLRRAKTL